MILKKKDKKQILRNKRILLAEDNEFNMEIAQSLLFALGAEVVSVTNGRSAIEAFMKEKREDFDFILMDIEMPQMDGWSATNTIRGLDHPKAKTIPIFAVTSNSTEADIRRCMEVGFNEHIAKPLSTDILVDKIMKYL